MNNFVKPGSIVTLTAPNGGVVSGTAYLVGSLLVVAAISAPAGAQFEGAAEGVFTLPKDPATAWTEGAILYWDTARSALGTAANATSLRAGCAVAAATQAATSGLVRLNGVPAPVNVA